MLLRVCCLVLLIVFGVPVLPPAAAQSTTLTGTVYSGDTFEPLPSAHVFLAGTMRGTVTDADGMFLLDRVPFGAQRLYVSMIGFEPAQRNLFLHPDTTYTFDIELRPAVYEVGRVTVEAERNRKWERQLKKFVRLFIGETENAYETTILNPEVLDFAVEDGRFVARTAEPLVIENRALGYRIRYYLRTFYEESSGSTQRIRYLGEPIYEAMTPADSAEAQRWAAKRRTAYQGSLRHFLRSLVANTVESEGFNMYFVRNSRRTPAQASVVLFPSRDPYVRLIDVQKADGLQVAFYGEPESYTYLRVTTRWARKPPGAQVTLLTPNAEAVYVDVNGTLLDPFALDLSGYMAFERVADALPFEYAVSLPRP